MEAVNIVIATNNEGKLDEVESFLKNTDISVKLLTLNDFPDIGELEESGETFRDNSYQKAKQVADRTGMLTIADDSGLIVDALEGEPGAYSARFAGDDASDEENNEKLLRKLQDVSYEHRTARFKCVISVVHPHLEAKFVEGSVEGYILESFIGNSGFGYDPLFYCPWLGKTFAELNKEEKSEVSHRGEALRQLTEELSDFISTISTMEASNES